MLKKIINITNVGRYKSFSGRDDDLSFKHNTFIYGKNTKGKTTLTAILKSLAIQNPDLIIGRRTFGSTTDQQVTLEMSEGNIFFRQNTWNDSYKIKIFDNQYVYENVYSDEVIDPEKQKNILNIILGSEGKKLDAAYNEAKRLCDENTKNKSALTREYGKILGNAIYSFDEFRSLQIDAIELEEEIKKTQNELDSYKNQALIKQVMEGFLTSLQIRLNRVDLEQTLSISSEMITAHIQKNIQGEGGDETLKFLELGTEFLMEGQESNCSYCGQDITNEPTKELIDAYMVMFSNQYKILNSNVKKSIVELRNFELINRITDLEKTLSKLGVNIDIDEKASASEHIKTLLGELETKKDNLDYNVDFNSLEQIEKIFQKIRQVLNPILIKYSNPIDPDDLQNKKNRLKVLVLQKERLNPIWIAKCDEYESLEKSFYDTLKPAEEESFQKRLDYAQTTLSGYESSINTILEQLGADFKLVDFNAPANRRDEMKIFTLIFGDQRVELKGKENNYDFKNTLSDSDKRLLAFAFFVVDTQNIENLDEYIIVFDDPMSSLDIDRKRMTIHTIRDCLKNSTGKIPSQKIILTHEDNFFQIAFDIYQHIPDSVFFNIEYDHELFSSLIKPCDVEEIFIKTEHIKDLEKFQQFINGKIDGYDLSKIRNGIEYVIKTKYQLSIPKLIIQNGGLVSWYIKNHCTGDESKRQLINDICPHGPHHDQTGIGVSLDQLEDKEKKDIARKYLYLVEII